ncbi:MAG: DsrE family protein [Desulfobacteraceae bacterium]|nr:DsrE family protein [Desulfobacteraceae bacterium]
MNVLFIISTDNAETAYNAMRLANVAVKKGDDVSVFMLGKGVLFEQSSTEQFNVMEQVNQYKGDFYV